MLQDMDVPTRAQADSDEEEEEPAPKKTTARGKKAAPVKKAPAKKAPARRRKKAVVSVTLLPFRYTFINSGTVLRRRRGI